MYATSDDYSNWLMGRAELIPLTEFNYWSNKASKYIDVATYGNIDDTALEQFNECIVSATCSIAEILYTQQSPNSGEASGVVSSESVGTWSISYDTKATPTKVTIDPLEEALDSLKYCNGQPTNLFYRGVKCKQMCCKSFECGGV